MRTVRTRFVSTFASATLAAGLFAGCCGICQKDPPCRPCENPCCLTPIQRIALEKSTHALPAGPEVYSYEGRTFVLFTETGTKDFHKDPGAYKEKGALRLVRKGQIYLVDVNPGDDFVWDGIAAGATPYSLPPKS